MSGPSVSMDSQTGAPAPVKARVTMMLMPGTLQTAGTFTGSQGSWGWKALRPILNVPISRDVPNSPQGI